MRTAKPSLRLLIGVIAVFAQLTSPLEAVAPDAHDGDASVVRIEEDGTRHEHGSPAQEPNHDNHAVHICHCIHAHSGIVSQGRTAIESGTEPSELPALEPCALPAPAPSEFFRPPIA